MDQLCTSVVMDTWVNNVSTVFYLIVVCFTTSLCSLFQWKHVDQIYRDPLEPSHLPTSPSSTRATPSVCGSSRPVIQTRYHIFLHAFILFDAQVFVGCAEKIIYARILKCLHKTYIREASKNFENWEMPPCNHCKDSSEVKVTTLGLLHLYEEQRSRCLQPSGNKLPPLLLPPPAPPPASFQLVPRISQSFPCISGSSSWKTFGQLTQ